MYFLFLWILFISMFTYILTSRDKTIPYFLFALFLHLNNSAFCQVPSVVTLFSIDKVLTHSIGLISFLHSETTQLHEMETLSALLALCEGIHRSLPGQTMWNFDVFLCQPKLTVEQTLVWPVIWDDDARVTFLLWINEIFLLNKKKKMKFYVLGYFCTYWSKPGHSLRQWIVHVKLIAILDQKSVLMI